MVAAVDTDGFSAPALEPLTESRIGRRNPDFVRQRIDRSAVGGVRHARRELDRQILPERTAEVDVDHLQATADPPHRQVQLPRGIEHVPLQLVALREGLDRPLGKDRLAIAGRFDVVATREQHSGSARGELPASPRRSGPTTVISSSRETDGPQSVDVRLGVPSAEVVRRIILFPPAPRSPCRPKCRASRSRVSRRAPPCRAAG